MTHSHEVRVLEFCLDGKGRPIGLLLAAKGSAFIQVSEGLGRLVRRFKSGEKRRSQRKCNEAGSIFMPSWRLNSENTWEVVVHEPASRFHLVRLA